SRCYTWQVSLKNHQRENTMKIRRSAVIVPIVLFAAALAGGYVWFWRLFITALVVLLFNFIWLRLSARAVTAAGTKPAALFRVGDRLEEEFFVYNSSRLPSPSIEIKEETDLPGYTNRVALNLPPHDSRSWRAGAVCLRRGQYAVGNLTLKLSDPLGIFSVEKQFGERNEVIVYPQTLELPYFQALPSQETGKSPRRWLASEAGPSTARLRDYTSSDSYHHIHWPTTAHTGKLMVRDFEPDRSNYNFRSLWIVPDMSAASRLGEGEESTEEYAIKIAASLAKKHIESGKEVGLIASGDRSYLCLPAPGAEQLNRLLLSLALMKAGGEVPLEDLIESQLDRFESGSVVLVIMPSGNQKALAPLRQLKNRSLIVTVVLFDASSFGGEAGVEDTVRSLIANGMHVYVMRRGSEITRALDSRLNFLQV
ncbi:MAG TPA: DUF58 domain-containing protein, partial [Dehalococcoidales bacterium]|nr:DUF58 domain-containing protein [Dehalococcoidales bacterium]